MPEILSRIPTVTASVMSGERSSRQGTRSAPIWLRVCGRDGGEGRFAIVDDPRTGTQVAGRYRTSAGVLIDFQVIRHGDMYLETVTGRRGATPESVLPLVVRDAPWEWVAPPRRDAPRDGARDAG